MMAWAAARVVKHDRPFLYVPTNEELLGPITIESIVSAVLVVRRNLSIHNVKVTTADLINGSRSIAAPENCDSISAEDGEWKNEEDR